MDIPIACTDGKQFRPMREMKLPLLVTTSCSLEDIVTALLNLQSETEDPIMHSELVHKLMREKG